LGRPPSQSPSRRALTRGCLREVDRGRAERRRAPAGRLCPVKEKLVSAGVQSRPRVCPSCLPAVGDRGSQLGLRVGEFPVTDAESSLPALLGMLLRLSVALLLQEMGEAVHVGG